MGRYVRANGSSLWVEERGVGSDTVLLISGLGDPLEAWSAQVDGLASHYRMVAFDARGVGRSALGAEPLSVSLMADDAAEILRATNSSRAHVAGYSGGGLVAQELCIRHADLVKSLVLVGSWAKPDRYARSMAKFWRWLVESAPSDKDFLEFFYLWIYSAQAHESGLVAEVIDETLKFPHPSSPEAMKEALDAFMSHDTLSRLNEIAVPTLVLSGENDIAVPPRHGRQVAAGIPTAEFRLLAGAAHQPFQEDPATFNSTVRDFWAEVDR
ncbi:alpha/beta hydrolase [Catellatospora sp. NPDC049609]|uniref:alpha/beta fold hydrolase n=1 Tax=Catellatospora sp. NPDC049609 TaxID=3155505 RepID=UPI00342F8E60